MKSSSKFLFFVSTLSLLFFVSCQPVTPPVTEPPVTATATPAVTSTFTPAYSLTLTAEAATLSSIETAITAATNETPAVTPTFTPPAGVTVVPVPGDLGWGAVYGKVLDGTTSLPIEGATVRCEHFSYTSPFPCRGISPTNADGIYSFVPVFFHDTDRITLIVEAPGYAPFRFEQSFFTQPGLHMDLELFPATGDTPSPTPYIMCTPPPCPGGAFACGDPNGCPGGCGTICLTATPTP